MSIEKADYKNISESELRELYEELLKEKQQLETDRAFTNKQMTKSRQRTIDLFGKMIDVKKAQRIISWQNEELEAKNKEINKQKKAVERTFQKFRHRTIDLFGKMIDLKKANRIIQQQNAEIEKQRKLLDETNTSKDKFFSILAHDLKNPIAGFLSLTEMMVVKKDKLAPETQQLFAENMYENSKQLYSLLENLLEWARSQTGSLKLHKDHIELKDLLDTVISQVSTNAKLKNVTILKPIRIEAKAFGDKDTLKTVLRNLLSNAIKFSKPGSDIEIAIDENASDTKISIIDFGVGISEENLEKLFKIENSVTSVGTADEKGTGLGLILCKEFMELNGGDISVKSEINKGSTFTITIPTKQV